MMKNLAPLRKIKRVKLNYKTIYKEKFNKDEEKLFMEIVISEDHSEMEGVMDLKAELMSALEELKKS